MDKRQIHLDPHCEAILGEYRSLKPHLNKLEKEIPSRIKACFEEGGIIVAALEHRIKEEGSLAGKLELKGGKYKDIFDITDILGLRVITFYKDDVDKVASIMERLFEIDWENSVDKRKLHEIDSFGYQSLHYICRLRETDYDYKECPELAKLRFEVQMRTILQHAWANMNHDTGYKSGVEVPKVYIRNLSRLAGMLELVDDEFSRIRTEINDYRRQVRSLVSSGNLDEAPLDGDTFRSYLEMGPFDKLNRKIAAVNQAEIMEVSLMNFLPLFKGMGFKNLGDIHRLIKNYGDAAYQMSCYQIGLSDIDIISSSLAPQNLCIAYILKSGGGKLGVSMMLEALNGKSESNEMMAEMLVQQAESLPFMNQ